MNQYYCRACGAGTNYASQPPKFCNACGQPYIGNNQVPSNQTLAAPIPKKVSQARQVIFVDPEEDLSEDSGVLPHIEKLAYTVKGGGSQRGERIRDIQGTEAIDTGRIAPVVKGKKGKVKPLSNAKILEQFKSEATPRGKANPIEIGG